MKKILNSAIVVLLILAIPIFVVRNFTLLRSKTHIGAPFTTFIPKNEYLTDKSFVFLLYSADPSPHSWEQNLQSIFTQKYDRFRVLLLLTENVEPQLDIIKNTAAKCNKEHLLSLVSLSEKVPNLHSFRKAIELCKDDEIIIHMDASGWLANENVLTTLNQIYASSENIWLTHCPCLEYPSYKTGQKNTPWHNSHFKTYYAGLFKQLQSNETNLNLCLQLLAKNSRKHIHFVDSTLYIKKGRA